MNKAKELTEILEGMGYKNFKVHEAIRIQNGLWEAEMTVRGSRNKVKIDLYSVTDKFTAIE